MILQKAPLVLKDFYVLETLYQYSEPDGEEIDINTLFDEYLINFDFRISVQENEEYHLYTKIAVNEPVDNNVQPGYMISVHSISILSIANDTDLTDQQKNDYLMMSGLSIAINNLRAYIMNLTSYYPLGRYQLPAIDMVKLHQDKSDSLGKVQKRNKK